MVKGYCLYAQKYWHRTWLAGLCYCFVTASLWMLTADKAMAGDGKLIATAGLQQVEGAGGGGLVPWATLSGHDTRAQTSGSVFMSRLPLPDFTLTAYGVSLSLYDRVELSVARQEFDIASLGEQLAQQIVGVKVRLYGDLVYSRWPQLSAGVQYKNTQYPLIPQTLGVQKMSGTDAYIAATKVHLNAIAGRNLIWNTTMSYTDANQFGLLGFGNANGHQRRLQFQGSIAVLLTRQLAIGFEYREKPNNLPLPEDNALDVFVTYIPSKYFNITAAWVDLGRIAGQSDQQGWYFSLGGQLW